MYNLVRRGCQLRTWRSVLVRNCASTTMTTAEAPRERIAYNEFLGRRRAEAKRSIVVQVSSEKSFPELYNYCSSFGSIVGAHHYRIRYDDELHYILLEFATPQEAAAAIDASTYNEEHSGVPANSPFLWFRATSKRPTNKALPLPATDTKLVTVCGTDVLEDEKLNEELRHAPSIEAQIHNLHARTQLNDLGVRLRFLAALQLQQAVSGMFPAANAQPFGSSVNGFGRMGCDLDLILRFGDERAGDPTTSGKRSEARLVFHTKENLTNGRSQTQRQMESIGDMLHLFLPGVCHVRRILQARVPIIKFHHEHLNLEVDLSMSNLTGFYMSELLYMFGEYDERVRPLIFTVRRWASACGLTNPSPGRWITNFSLTCLVIFFLQQLKQPILPTINGLMKAATKEDMRFTEDGINCTFGRCFDRVGFKTQNRHQINELLLQFFEFYSQFDFGNRAMSLNEGRAIGKPDHSALYIVNPLEQLLNVSKNVSLEECERLRMEVRNAAWVLESEVEGNQLTASERQEAAWGLLNLFKTNEKAIIRPNMFFKPRMVEVSDLFENPPTTDASALPPTSLPAGATPQPPTPPPPPPQKPATEFRNESVRQQVQNIKAQGRNDLQQMRVKAVTAAGATGGVTSASSSSSSQSKGRSKRSR